MPSTRPRPHSHKRVPVGLPAPVVVPRKNSQCRPEGSTVTRPTEESRTLCVHCKEGFRQGPEYNCRTSVCSAAQRPEYTLEFLSGDVMDDAYRGNTTILAQVVDCAAVKPFGSSKVLADKYPFSNPYQKRRRLGPFNRALQEDRVVPGKITLDTSGDSEHYPMVANLFAQFYSGKPFEANIASQHLVKKLRLMSRNVNQMGFNEPGRSDDHFLEGIQSDTLANRTRWFLQCVGRMLDIPGRFDVQKVVFVYNAENGFSLEDWEKFYVPTIRRFADWVSAFRIKVLVLNMDQNTGRTVRVHCKEGFRQVPEYNCRLRVCPAVQHPEYTLEFLSGDVMDDAYRGSTTILAQVVDCAAVKPFGSSKVLADKYPFSNPYQKRRRLGPFNRALQEDRVVPGRITLDTSGDSEHYPMVANLFAQFYSGKPFEANIAIQHLVKKLRLVSRNENQMGFNGPSRSDDHFLEGLQSDTLANRTRWFLQCVGRMLDIPGRFDVQKVVFVYKTENGFSLEDWEEFYVPTIRRFADWVSAFRIKVLVLNMDQNTGRTVRVHCKEGFRQGPEYNCRLRVCPAVQRPEYTLEFLSGDVMDDAYRGNTTILAQVVDCAAVKPFGSSKVLADKYPFSNPYQKRRRLGSFNRALQEDRVVPGKITLDTSGASENYPMVANLFAQFYSGKPFEANIASQHLVKHLRLVSRNKNQMGFNGPSRSDDHFLEGLQSDTLANRTLWFLQCVGRMLDIPGRFNVQKVVFVYKTENRFSLEDWEKFYVPTIRRFADWVSAFRIKVLVLNMDQNTG
ncbi:uncharacterized protein [Palaemon carinicauda]|uniref:uncharacterized protein n=1 Tax=Palaemon carinicauda TaxID=392227 RepID=UPI0035B5832F